MYKLVQNETEWLETYYIHDEFGLLRYVIQPEGTARLLGDPDENFLSNWAFSYKYDQKKRLVEKRIPGASPVWMAYDDIDLEKNWEKLLHMSDNHVKDKLLTNRDGNLVIYGSKFIRAYPGENAYRFPYFIE